MVLLPLSTESIPSLPNLIPSVSLVSMGSLRSCHLHSLIKTAQPSKSYATFISCMVGRSDENLLSSMTIIFSFFIESLTNCQDVRILCLMYSKIGLYCTKVTSDRY